MTEKEAKAMFDTVQRIAILYLGLSSLMVDYAKYAAAYHRSIGDLLARLIELMPEEVKKKFDGASGMGGEDVSDLLRQILEEGKLDEGDKQPE